jgi:HD-like signal output (HDOD) protein
VTRPDPQPPTQFLSQPLPNLAAWTRHFGDTEIPIQADTAARLEALRADEDNVDANLLRDMAAGDPLMTLKIMAWAARNRPERRVTETETVTAGLVMMGVAPFFREFGPQPTIEDRLAQQPQALAGLRAVLDRAYRAANFALCFVVHRMEHDADQICLAALLHDFAEMLLWCHAPALALQIRDAQRADPQLRSADIQKRVLGLELTDLQQALMKTWHLPQLLVRISDDKHATVPNVLSVTLAIRLARHTTHGWDNPAIPDDIHEIAALLNLAPGAALELVKSIDR